MNAWYAVYCKPRQDARAAQHLRNQGYEIFQPLARTRKLTASGARYAIEPLFPRYLFIRLDDEGGQSWGPIRSTRGVSGLVQIGDTRQPARVPDALVEALQVRQAERGWLELDSARALRPDDPVTVVEGAFAGCEAVFEARSGSERVVVLLKLLGAERRLVLTESAVIRRKT